MDYFTIIQRFWQREKTALSAEELAGLDIQEILVWAWCTGMGSDSYILLVCKDGRVLEYQHYRSGKDFAAFEQLEQTLTLQNGPWSLLRCEFRNHLYYRKEDTDLQDLLIPNVNPLFCLERICRQIA